MDKHKDDELGNIVFEKNTLLDLSEILSRRTDYFWTFKGKNKEKFALTIDISSTETIIASLKYYGLKVKEKPVKIDTVYLIDN